MKTGHFKTKCSHCQCQEEFDLISSEEINSIACGKCGKETTIIKDKKKNG